LGRPAWIKSIKPEETTMAAQVKPVPEGYHTVTPYLVVDGAEKIIKFMKDAFGAQPVFEPMMRPDGKVMHAEFKIGNSIVMLADSSERAQATSTMLYLYVPNVDAVYQKAIKAGGTSLMEPADQFYGDRSGGVKDPAGNRWHIGTHIENVSPAELKKRAAEVMKQQNKAA
jgi:PhnB protein